MSDTSHSREDTPPRRGKCATCGRTYPMEVTDGGDVVPLGIDDICVCGSTTFELFSDEEVL